MGSTIFYAVKINTMFKADGYAIANFKEEVMEELTEHLAMNGYTFDTNGEDIIFIYDDELDYLLNILDDRNLMYEVI